MEKDARFFAGVSDLAGTDDSGNDRALVFPLTTGVQSALAASAPDALRGAVQEWMRTEELRQFGWEEVTVDKHLEFVTQAKAADQRLYCYIEP